MTDDHEETTNPEVDALIAAAQDRDEDPDGDHDSEDGGAYEEFSETDPEPLLNEDAEDDFADLADGDDVGDMDE